MIQQIASVLNARIDELGISKYKIKQQTGMYDPTLNAILGKTNTGYNIENLAKVMKCLDLNEIVINKTKIKL